MARKKKAPKLEELPVEQLTAMWAEKLKLLKENHTGRVPKDRETEERLAEEMTDIFLALPADAQKSLERPEPPRYRDRPIDLIALNEKGNLIGFEDEFDDRPMGMGHFED